VSLVRQKNLVPLKVGELNMVKKKYREKYEINLPE
jgi:hypothetical protein